MNSVVYSSNNNNLVPSTIQIDPERLTLQPLTLCIHTITTSPIKLFPKPPSSTFHHSPTHQAIIMCLSRSSTFHQTNFHTNSCWSSPTQLYAWENYLVISSNSAFSFSVWLSADFFVLVASAKAVSAVSWSSYFLSLQLASHLTSCLISYPLLVLHHIIQPHVIIISLQPAPFTIKCIITRHESFK